LTTKDLNLIVGLSVIDLQNYLTFDYYAVVKVRTGLNIQQTTREVGAEGVNPVLVFSASLCSHPTPSLISRGDGG
jgi:hypothetical protein